MQKVDLKRILKGSSCELKEIFQFGIIINLIPFHKSLEQLMNKIIGSKLPYRLTIS